MKSSVIFSILFLHSCRVISSLKSASNIIPPISVPVYKTLDENIISEKVFNVSWTSAASDEHLCGINDTVSSCIRSSSTPYKSHRYTLQQFLAVFPSIGDSLPVDSLNEQCAKHSRFVLNSANNMDMWALKMLDASGKISSGILNGNVNQMGDFDQCLGVSGIYENMTDTNAKANIYGKYCLAAVDIRLPPSLGDIDRYAHSHYMIRSKMQDPGHRIPKYANMYWAVCVPHTCSPQDVQSLVNSVLQRARVPEMQKQVMVDESMCHTRRREVAYSFGTIMAVLFFIGILALVAVSTIFHKDTNGTMEQKNPPSKSKIEIVLESFSLKKNLRTLFSLKGEPDDVACLHGVRALSAIALLLAHKCMQLKYYPYINRTVQAEYISYPWSMVGRSAIVYTDSFILISGCLAAKCFLKHFDRGQNRIISSYVSRFFRLTPNLAAIILFCTFILPVLNTGPMWNFVVTRHAELCSQHWWKNIIYVHNYFGFEEMCLTHTHQIGIDMQLYVTSPILIYLLWKKPKIGMTVSVTLAVISTYLRYTVTLQNNLSPIIYFGVSVSQLFNTATLSYILPTHRATVYIIGILFGYYLHHRSTVPIKLSYAQVQFGTFFFTIVGFVAMYGPYWMADRHYKYNAKEAAIYMAFSPIAWCSALIWAILINVHGYTGTIGEIMRWPGFRVFTRIAYALHLVQFPVYFYNVGVNRSPRYFTPQVLFNIEEYAIIFGLSFLLTALIELPFLNIRKYLKFDNSTTLKQCEKIEKVK